MSDRFEIIVGDITKITVDAIVNAANTTLMGGGGVDGAIHRAAGPQLLEECKKIGGCPTGEARITKGYNLPAKFIIHTVGPIWQGGSANEAELLRLAYYNSLLLAQKHNIKTIAFPSISTGAYRFPLEKASLIAVSTILDFLKNNNIPEKVFFVAFSDEVAKAYQNAYQQITEKLNKKNEY